jgi:hypothetical protein
MKSEPVVHEDRLARVSYVPADVVTDGLHICAALTSHHISKSS